MNEQMNERKSECKITILKLSLNLLRTVLTQFSNEDGNWNFSYFKSPSQKPATFIIGNKTDKTLRCVTKEQAEHVRVIR